jgi:Ca2+-binding EF-hand superfamily protein
VLAQSVAPELPPPAARARGGPPPAVPPTGAALTPTTLEPAEAVFNRLDHNRKGFLTRDQVASLDGFSFDAADTNHDGRLTSEEFAKAWADYASWK